MVMQWKRLPDNDAAGKASSDTTEVEIGNLTVPEWARSIIAVHIHPILLALTSDEEVSGYFRLVNDENTLDPLNFPLPIAQTLTGTTGTHFTFPVTVPCFHDITKNDTLRVYMALDAATTGAHTYQAYVLLSSRAAPFQMKADKSDVVSASTSANTKSGTVTTINTITDRTSEILGVWNYFVSAGGITAGQTVGGYIIVESDLAGWLTQRIPTNIMPSGLSTVIQELTQPVISVPPLLRPYIDGLHYVPWIEPFRTTGKQGFKFENIMDGTNTNAPKGRYGLIWKE
jgi:hypothetical protein